MQEEGITYYNLTGGTLPLDTIRDSRAAEETQTLTLPSQYKFFNSSLLKSSRWVAPEQRCNLRIAMTPIYQNISMDGALEVPAYTTGTLECKSYSNILLRQRATSRSTRSVSWLGARTTCSSCT